MARQKGDGLGRLGGRKKGTPNRTTQEMRNTISEFTSANFDDFTRTWKEIRKPEQKCSIYIDLLKYAIPALSSVGIDIDTDAKQKLSVYLKSLRDGDEKTETPILK